MIGYVAGMVAGWHGIPEAAALASEKVLASLAGIAFGALADSLERTARQADVREFVSDGKLVLLTPYAPTAGFSVGAAMGRNKLIYGLAEFAVRMLVDPSYVRQAPFVWA